MKNIDSQRIVNETNDESKTPQFDLNLLWLTFRRNWPWAFPTGLAFSALAVWYVMSSFVPTYRASSLLEANTDYLVFKGVMPVVKNLTKTEKPLIFHAIVLDSVLSNDENRKAPSLSDPDDKVAEVNLRKNLSVGSGGADSRLEVSYVDSDPVMAAKICKAVVDSYLKQRMEFDIMRVSNLERWLEPEIQRWQQEVEQAQIRVSELSKQTFGHAPGQKAALMEQENNLALATRLQAEMADINLEISIAEARVAMRSDEVDNVDDSNLPAIDDVTEENLKILGLYVTKPQVTDFQISQLALSDPEVKKANLQIDHYQGLKRDLEDQDRVGVKRADYNRYCEKLSEWKSTLEQAKIGAASRARKQLEKAADAEYSQLLTVAKAEALQIYREDATKRKLIIEQELEDLEALKKRLEIVSTQYATEKQRLEAFGGVTAEYQFAQEEYEVARSVLTKLQDRKAAIRTERRQDGTVRMIAEAVPPRTPVEPVPFKKLAGLGGAAFIIPFLFGLLLEFRTQRLTDSNMCEKHGFAVIGEIARIPNKLSGGKSRRVFEESVDTLRACLALSNETRKARTFGVVSSMTGEGKSSVSSQLAISIAKANGKTVLLVDADLRCPDQHEIFGLNNEKGLSTVLFGSSTLEESVDTSYGDLVHILTSGPLLTNPHRLINVESFRRFITEALEHYEYIVVDTAPVLSAGESLAVASTVDSTLVCLMRDVSRIDNVNRAVSRLEAAGATISGTVFSGVSARQYSYRYGDYRYAPVSVESTAG